MPINYETAWGVNPFSLAEVASLLPDDQAAAWYQRIKALDNLLALYGLERSEKLYGSGFVVSHRRAPNLTRWIDPNDSEESWLENAKLLDQR